MPRTVAVLILLVALGGIAGRAAFAQAEGGPYGADAFTSQDRSARLLLEPTYQSYENTAHKLAEWSLPFRLTIPIRDRWQVRAEGSVASVRREGGAGVAGLTDVQAALSYTREIGESSLIVNANLNLPTGKQELTPEEFKTTTLLSQNIYDFQVSGFGQGFGVSTGATWAVPVGDRFALGLGGSYQMQGGYTPIADMVEAYDPGNQVLVTGGIEYRIARTMAFSVNGSITFYGTDTVGGAERFDAGTKGAAEVQFVREWGYNALQLVARYEGRGQGSRPVARGGGFDRQVLPDLGQLHGRFETRLSGTADLALWAVGRKYGATVAHEQETIVVGGAGLSVELGSGLSVAPRASYTTGTFTGFANGLAVGWEQ